MIRVDYKCEKCANLKSVITDGKTSAIRPSCCFQEMTFQGQVVFEESKHPLLNPESTHYQMIDGVESVERLEQMYSSEEMQTWAKITAMKYRLRICNKDDVEKEAVKIRGYEAYYKYLDEK